MKSNIQIESDIKESWKIIAPFWPLKNLIAVNPLQGLEDLAFEEGLIKGSAYFEAKELPEFMEKVNLETIKWLQAFFDEGQATISMPGREEGLYKAWKQLAIFDTKLYDKNKEKYLFLSKLASSSKEAIIDYLNLLEIKPQDQIEFLKLLLTTLPGWASYIKYRCEWSEPEERYPVSQEDYLAIRIVITYLLWPQAKNLLQWHKSLEKKKNPIVEIESNENKYRTSLLKQLSTQALSNSNEPNAQLVFCIDVRSEPFRRALENTGRYETFGFAGFFGIPAKIENTVTGESCSSCPVLLKPKHTIKESSNCPKKEHSKYQLLKNLKLFYQSLKYNFTTAFALVEGIGIFSAIWMLLRAFTPRFADFTSNIIKADKDLIPSLDDISLSDQCSYAESALRMIGLTKNFAPLVVLCGHGSSTKNNAFATALDCGACGGRHGASNARILAAILNNVKVREILAEKQILIPNKTVFIASLHNTTNDEVKLYNYNDLKIISQLNQDLKIARNINSQFRCEQMGIKTNSLSSSVHTNLRSIDWSQVRPEWGLARNSAFIIAPRNLSKNINLEGRCFLHSYDYNQDLDGSSLNTILTAPMIVAQWINAQYLFSTLDNVAYGAGSKITKNITGKIGIMQGNASDLMTGLPLQSVYISDTKQYHEVQRLMTVVYAPRAMIDQIIVKQDILKKLFGNGWVTLSCIDPHDHKIYFLKRDLKWEKAI